MKNFALLLLALLAFVSPTVSHAQWQLDGINLSLAPSTQNGQVMVSDGAGGSIVAWADFRGGPSSDIYAQRINKSGAVQWTSAGVPICTAVNDQNSLVIASDGAGGAIIAWGDLRSSGLPDIYAQRVNAAGVVQWAANGVVICNAANNQTYLGIIPDGAGGAIMTWSDNRIGPDYDVYVQRVNASGVTQWTSNGIPIGSANNDQINSSIVADGAGGAIVAWQDYRSGNYDIYAERINASGSLLWIFPTIVCNATGDQFQPQLASDGAAGALLTWSDFRNGNSDVYIQRVNSSGTVQWTANGLAVCALANSQIYPVIMSDGAGGAIVCWPDVRSGSNTDLYAQRIGALGSPLWIANGVAVAVITGEQTSPAIVTDGSGGAIISWEDSRSGGYDIFAQRVTAAGSVQWTTNGVPVCSAPDIQNTSKVVTDGAGAAIIAWSDNRNIGGLDVFLQRVDGRYGYWGRPEPILDVVKDNKNDQGGKVVLNWRPSGRDVLNQQTITLYSIWRALDVAPALALLSSGSATAIDTPSSKKAKASGHTLWIERSPATSYYWELIGSTVANYSDAYSFLASTRQDSTAASAATTQFRVVAESYNQFINWPSNVLSGRSVDNLAPAAPLFLSAQRIGNWVHLKWNRVHVSDLKNYAVYRKTSSGVTPIPANFLADNTDTVLVDTTAPNSALYYIVTAYDVHANQSAPSNEAAVGSSTHVGDLPPVTQLTVLQNHPNPFAQSTELEVGLPSAEPITVDVYDVAGRRVREFEIPGAKGWQEVALNGVNQKGEPLASGVYFYKIHAGAETLTRKMLIAR